MVLPLTAGAQPPPPAGGPRAASKPAPSAFAVVPWLSFTPVGASLIRTPEQLDMEAREDQTYITVFGKKKKPDVGPRRDDVYTPLNSEASIPVEIPVMPTQNCSNAAYDTVAGQAGTSGSMFGALGGGRC
jgi:hypothetical protein